MQCKWHPIHIRSQINKGLGLGIPDAPTQHEIPDPCSLQQLLAPTPFYRKGLESLCLCEFTGHFLACNRRDGLEGMDYKVVLSSFGSYTLSLYMCALSFPFPLFFGFCFVGVQLVWCFVLTRKWSRRFQGMQRNVTDFIEFILILNK